MNLDEARRTIECVAFELSNYCPLAHEHAMCPAHLVDQIEILPLDLVEKVLHELSHWDYSGKINLHRYSEPLTDPRTFLIMEKVCKLLPEATISMSTNGMILTQQMLAELYKYGLRNLYVSLYGSQWDRMMRAYQIIEWAQSYPELNLVQSHPERVPFDLRLLQYDGPPIDQVKPCRAPLRHINISCFGDVVLCCLDWRNSIKFGNIREATLSQIIMGDRFQAMHARLISGDRSTSELCRRCSSQE